MQCSTVLCEGLSCKLKRTCANWWAGVFHCVCVYSYAAALIKLLLLNSKDCSVFLQAIAWGFVRALIQQTGSTTNTMFSSGTNITSAFRPLVWMWSSVNRCANEPHVRFASSDRCWTRCLDVCDFLCKRSTEWKRFDAKQQTTSQLNWRLPQIYRFSCLHTATVSLSTNSSTGAVSVFLTCCRRSTCVWCVALSLSDRRADASD